MPGECRTIQGARPPRHASRPPNSPPSGALAPDTFVERVPPAQKLELPRQALTPLTPSPRHGRGGDHSVQTSYRSTLERSPSPTATPLAGAAQQFRGEKERPPRAEGRIGCAPSPLSPTLSPQMGEREPACAHPHLRPSPIWGEGPRIARGRGRGQALPPWPSLPGRGEGKVLSPLPAQRRRPAGLAEGPPGHETTQGAPPVWERSLCAG